MALSFSTVIVVEKGWVSDPPLRLCFALYCLSYSVPSVRPHRPVLPIMGRKWIWEFSFNRPERGERRCEDGPLNWRLSWSVTDNIQCLVTLIVEGTTHVWTLWETCIYIFVFCFLISNVADERLVQGLNAEYALTLWALFQFFPM